MAILAPERNLGFKLAEMAALDAVVNPDSYATAANQRPGTGTYAWDIGKTNTSAAYSPYQPNLLAYNYGDTAATKETLLDVAHLCWAAEGGLASFHTPQIDACLVKGEELLADYPNLREHLKTWGAELQVPTHRSPTHSPLRHSCTHSCTH